MDIATARAKYCGYLANVSDTPNLDVELLLSEVLSLSKAQLLAYSEQVIPATKISQIESWVRRRRAGEPLAYIVGHQPFWTLDLSVTPATLIPRSETELLVEWILRETRQQKSLSVVDLGVGSGAIALALAKERPDWSVDAVDRCENALRVARKNAVLHDVHNVTFYHGSWFQPLPPNKQYHIIVSNPPYISKTDLHLKKLGYEPYGALVSEQNGLADLVSIITRAAQYLLPNGYLVVEHGFEQGDAVIKKMQQAGWVNIKLHRDLSQQPRFVTACRSQ